MLSAAMNSVVLIGTLYCYTHRQNLKYLINAEWHANICTLNKWRARILPGVFPLMEQMAKVPSTLEAQDTQLASSKIAN
jgi:hypothetical protein